VSPFVLASASQVRARLLAAAGVQFQIVPARIDEQAVKETLADENPRTIADALAELKALRVASSYTDVLVLGADQVLAFNGVLIDKSGNLDEARMLLRRLRGGRHELFTAVVLARNGAAVWRHTDRAGMWMRDFSDEFLEDYLAREGGAVLDSVGCYHFEGLGAQLFARIEGDYFSVLGLPLLPLLAALREHGVVAR
jgi:septum formation protein